MECEKCDWCDRYKEEAFMVTVCNSKGAFQFCDDECYKNWEDAEDEIGKTQKMNKDRIELMEEYGIKLVGEGVYGTGFFDCLRLMDVECTRLKEIINEKDKIILKFVNQKKSEGRNEKYNEKWDSYYDDKKDIWLESPCQDSNCKFCKDRPTKPSECVEDN